MTMSRRRSWSRAPVFWAGVQTFQPMPAGNYFPNSLSSSELTKSQTARTSSSVILPTLSHGMNSLSIWSPDVVTPVRSAVKKS